MLYKIGSLNPPAEFRFNIGDMVRVRSNGALDFVAAYDRVPYGFIIGEHGKATPAIHIAYALQLSGSRVMHSALELIEAAR